MTDRLTRFFYRITRLETFAIAELYRPRWRRRRSCPDAEEKIKRKPKTQSHNEFGYICPPSVGVHECR